MSASKVLCIDKSSGNNEFIRIGISEIDNLDDEQANFKEGPECTNRSQILRQTEKVVGRLEDTKRLFTHALCRLKTKKNGFIIPLYPGGVRYY